MQFSIDERHTATLDLLSEVRDYIASLPRHPMNREMIERIEAHLSNPVNEIARHVSTKRTGATYTPAGLHILTVTAEGDTVTVTASPKGKGAPDELLIKRLRRGERITLHPNKSNTML